MQRNSTPRMGDEFREGTPPPGHFSMFRRHSDADMSTLGPPPGLVYMVLDDSALIRLTYKVGAWPWEYPRKP